jgi:hypothetical protein
MSQTQVSVISPSASYTDGTYPFQTGGKQGDGLVSELHGKWYTAAYRNRVFFGSSLIAGVTIPVNTATAATFTLYNPIGSGVNVEMISVDIGWPAAATTVVASILGSISTQTPTSVTEGGATIKSIVGVGAGGTAAAKLYTAATITAITTHIPLFIVTTTAMAMVSSHYDFDGKLILAPGGLITLTSSPVQTGVAIPSFAWAEWPQ